MVLRQCAPGNFDSSVLWSSNFAWIFGSEILHHQYVLGVSLRSCTQILAIMNVYISVLQSVKSPSSGTMHKSHVILLITNQSDDSQGALCT
jgi:hypothetical protein